MLLAARRAHPGRRADAVLGSRAPRSPGPLFKSLQPATARGRAGRDQEPRRPSTLDAVVTTTGVPVEPEPAGGNGFTIERALLHRPKASRPTSPRSARTTAFVVVLTVTADQAREQAARGRPDPGRLRDREPEHLGERR